MRLLDGPVEAIANNDQGWFGDRVRVVCQKGNLSHVQTIKVAGPSRHLQPRRDLRLLIQNGSGQIGPFR